MEKFTEEEKNKVIESLKKIKELNSKAVKKSKAIKVETVIPKTIILKDAIPGGIYKVIECDNLTIVNDIMLCTVYGYNKNRLFTSIKKDHYGTSWSPFINIGLNSNLESESEVLNAKAIMLGQLPEVE